MKRSTHRFVLLSALSAALITGWAPVQAEEGGKGDKFKAFGPVLKDIDPENATNDVISWDTTGDARPGIERKLHKKTKIDQLDNQVQLKYFMVGPRTCVGGAPRIQLAVDKDGDGEVDGNAFGYLGNMPFGGLCPAGEWVFEDMTNSVTKWDLSQFGGSMTSSWSDMEAFFMTTFPAHQVLRGVVVDDACGFALAACGKVYFDNVVIGNRSVDDHEDVSGAKKP